MSTDPPIRDLDIAIVGQACRVPGADTPDAFWQMVEEGREAVVDVGASSLRASGVTNAELADPHYVRRAAIMRNVMGFDAGFFGLSALDAALLDPQHRHFLEVCWEALESAAHAPARFDGRIGVFAGVGMQGYFANHLLPNAALMREHGLFLVRHTGNDKDFLPTRVSYEFDLRGPSVAVQTACSTSLVAVHIAAQSLLNMECDLALAGGVTIELPHGVGYTHVPGEILSPDGHCRSFDANASGTVFGSGCGVVALRRGLDAYEDGDNILAIIRATAINNDGRRKVGYLAPSVDGQAAAIAEALELAEVEPEEIGLVEAHGTATPVGDPIEVAALKEAFGDAPAGDRCVLSSVKSNIGHLDTAAGVAALIKATAALRHRVLPPTLHFDTPNPALGLEASPFHVLKTAQPWLSDSARFACVNSIGVGGTNAHAVLREAPERPARPTPNGPYWLPLSAKSPAALDELRKGLARRLTDAPDLDLSDVAFTLQEGRAEFKHRAVFAGSNLDELLVSLSSACSPKEATGHKRVVWAFAGGGAGSPGMLRVVYDRFPVIRSEVDACLATLGQLGASAVRDAVLNPNTSPEELRRPSVALPSLMVAQLAMAAQLSAWGITPDVCVGHSMGEYTAACISGAIARSDALRIVLERGRLFETLPPGAMLSVSANAEVLQEHLGSAVDIAADNAPMLTLASGTQHEIDALSERLTRAGIDNKQLRISVAAHSRLLDPILPAFEAAVRRMSVSRPNLPVISTRLAKPIASEWCDASYWIDHLRHPVRFREAMSEALAPGPALVFDVGPGRTMSALAEANESWDDHHQTCQTLSREDALAENAATTLAAYAAPWLQGAEAAWADVRPRREHRRVALPTYAWQHSQYCFDVPKSAAVIEHAQNNLYALTLEPWNGETNALPEGAIALAHSAGDGALETLREVFSDRRVVSLQTGPDTQRTHALTWTVSDGDEQILQRLRARHGLLAAYIDLREPSPEVALLRAHSIATSALASDESLRLLFVRRTPDSESAGVFAGVVPVLRTELPHVSARVVDVSAAGTSGLRVLRTELERDDLSWSLWRDGVRHRRVAAPAASSTLSERQFATSWDEESVLLVSGGFGGIAQALIEGLSTEHPGLRVALLSRTGLPSPPDDSVADDPYAQRRTAVAGLRNLGCRVVVHAVDVCDADAVARVTRAVEHELGPIGAVLHTAGRLDDALIGTRPADELQAVLAPKVQGARNLVNAISHRPNAWFIAFSSTSAFSGLPGQLSYAAANAWLDDYARRLAGAGRMAMSLAWPAWRETGMAANRLATLRGEYGPPSVAGPGVRVVERTHDTLTLRITLRESDWVLADHRLRGGGTVLPGAALIAYAYGAALEQQPNTPCSLRDTVFEQPVFVHGTRGVFLRIAGDRWRIEGDDRTVYCQGRYDDVPDGDTRQLSMPELSLRASDAADHQHMLFGERWQCIEGFAHDGQDRWTSLRLPAAFEADLKQWPIHPALLDFAIASGVSLSEQEPFFVPFAIERVDIYGAIPEQSYSRTTLTREQHETLTFASDVAAADGRVIVRVSGFVQRAVSNVSALVQRSNVAGTIDAASALQSALLKGIDNKTGIRAFLDSLEVPGANHLVVGTSPPAIGAAVVQRAAPTLTSTAQTGVAPSSSTESLVAEIWTQLLGAPVTDVDADFFALGGHSLNAIRLISRLNDKLGTSLAMSALFECPTVRSLSTLLDARSEGSPPLERAPETSAESAITLNSPSSLLPTMSAAQRGIWFQERSAPQGSAFHVCGAYRLSRTPDLSALAAAVRAVGDRHIALRCRFPAVNGLPEAVVSPEGSISLAHDQYATDEGWADRVAATTFDVEQGPLCRIVLGSHESGTEGSSTDAEPEATLLVVVHHIVCDEWSLEVIIDELSALYEAALGGVTGNALLKLLPPAPALFAAYAGGVTAPTAADGRRQALAGAPMVLPLPHDHAPRDSGVRAGKRLVRMAPAPVGRALREFSSDAGVSLFVSMLALYVAFVARWSGQNDVLVGTPASTRDTQELESAVGLFIDTVVVRGELDDSPSLTTLARRTRDDVLRAFDEERVPFGELVRALGGARTPGVHPLYQTMLAVYPVERSLSLGTIAAQPLHVDAGGVQVDLTLYVADHGDALEWIAEYDTGVFASETIERALKRFEHLILAAAAAPGTSLLALDALPSAERDALISWGTGPSALRRDDDLVLHRMQQRDASQKTAVFAGSHSLTYRELASLRRRAASQLVDAGVKPGQTVAVALTRRAELPAILLAIWEVGATYLPIDVHFPEDRIEWMLRDSGATHIYTEDALQDALISDLPRVSLELIPRRAKQIPATPQNAEAAAYVIYTSGSTGKPKGVRVPHGAVANFVASMCREPGITASDNLLAVTTISFDISVLEVFAPLVAGATLTIASESESKDAFALIRLLDDQRVSVMQATPSTWRMLVAAEWAGAGVKALCGGEPLPRDLAQALVPRVSALWNMYGPTETTVWSTCAKIDDPSERIRIGLPIDNTRVAVASVNGRLQPVGVPGELLIGGAGLALGYQNRPVLTAERFETLRTFAANDNAPVDEAAQDAGDERLSPRTTNAERWYHTGDIARWTHDGRLEHLGRSDAQVKLRGFRIELGEIEAVAGAAERVTEVAVNVFDFGEGDARLVGFFVGDGSVEPQQLTSLCADSLPEYMVPRQWVRLERLPLTPNGKLDRAALSPPERKSSSGDGAPRTEAERWLAEVWARLLGMDGLRQTDNFFDVGGHSLLSMTLIHEVENATGVRLNPLQLSTQTLAQIAGILPFDQEADQVANPGSEASTRRSIQLTPQLLDAPEGHLFILHTAPIGDSNSALLLAPPLIHEVQASARSLRVLSERAAHAGVHCARFDYWGTGDSSGELADARIERWVEDIVLACEALRAQSGHHHITVLAPRLSAALVCLAAPRLGDVSVLVWSPLMDGAVVLRNLEREHAEWQARELRERPKAERMFDDSLLGFALSPSLRSDLGRLRVERWPDKTRALLHAEDAIENDGELGERVVTLSSGSPWRAAGDREPAPVAVDAVQEVLKMLRPT